MVSKQRNSLLLFQLLVLNVFSPTYSQQKWFQLKTLHQAIKLNDQQLKFAATLSNMQEFDKTLDPILVDRVVGTPNHALVRQYLIDQMSSLGWDISTDQFSDRTPYGRKTFENIIATLDPKAPRNLVLACHYDSKMTTRGNREKETFIGAIDSAVPCAMLITLAKELSPQLDQLKESGKNVSLQFIFFDGEEAFKNWSDWDSLYGSRHLAAKWERKPYPEQNRDGTNELHRMDLMVLLDLIGSQNPTFYSYVPSGQRWFTHAADIENRLKQNSLLKTQSRFFSSELAVGGIEDDHVPFMKKGVPILHIIPAPFPDVWHTNADNKAALDFNTIEDLLLVFRVFVLEYLQMSNV